jgi:hypothetical protein
MALDKQKAEMVQGRVSTRNGHSAVQRHAEQQNVGAIKLDTK